MLKIRFKSSMFDPRKSKQFPLDNMKTPLHDEYNYENLSATFLLYTQDLHCISLKMYTMHATCGITVNLGIFQDGSLTLSLQYNFCLAVRKVTFGT